MTTYNREILSRHKQQKLLKEKQLKAGRSAAKKGNIIGVIKSARKAKNLNDSLIKLGSAYVSPKPYKKKNYN